MDTRENYCQFSHLLLPRINFCFANVFFQSNSSAIPANPGEAGGRNAPLSHFAVTGGFKAPQGSGRRHEQDQQPWTSLDKWSLWAGRTRTAAPQPPRGAPGASEAEGKPQRGGPDPHTHPAPRRMGFGGPGSPWLTLTSHRALDPATAPPTAEQHSQARICLERKLRGLCRELGGLEAQGNFPQVAESPSLDRPCRYAPELCHNSLDTTLCPVLGGAPA